MEGLFHGKSEHPNKWMRTGGFPKKNQDFSSWLFYLTGSLTWVRLKAAMPDTIGWPMYQEDRLPQRCCFATSFGHRMEMSFKCWR
jgi:hypothetical protein